MARKNLVERRFQKFLRTPLSVRNAMAAIVSATIVTVLVGGILIRLVDPTEVPDIGTGLWWALQTVTTVGYGDVTTSTVLGRFIGALFMLEAIAFVAIITAAITSSFVERARRDWVAETDAAEADRIEELSAQLADVTARLEQIQETLESRRSDD